MAFDRVIQLINTFIFTLSVFGFSIPLSRAYIHFFYRCDLLWLRYLNVFCIRIIFTRNRIYRYSNFWLIVSRIRRIYSTVLVWVKSLSPSHLWYKRMKKIHNSGCNKQFHLVFYIFLFCVQMVLYFHPCDAISLEVSLGHERILFSYTLCHNWDLRELNNRKIAFNGIQIENDQIPSQKPLTKLCDLSMYYYPFPKTWQWSIHILYKGWAKENAIPDKTDFFFTNKLFCSALICCHMNCKLWPFYWQ